MSTNQIDEMTEQEAKSLLNEIANEFGIGGKARTAGVILTNIQNSNNHEFCRSEQAELENAIAIYWREEVGELDFEDGQHAIEHFKGKYNDENYS